MEHSEILNHFLVALNNFDANEAAYWCRIILNSNNVSAVPLDQVFIGFHLGDEDLSKLLARLTWEVVRFEDFPVILQKFEPQLLEGLNSNLESLNQLCVDVVFQLGLLKGHSVSETTLAAAIKLIASDHSSVSASVIKVIGVREYVKYFKLLICFST